MVEEKENFVWCVNRCWNTLHQVSTRTHKTKCGLTWKKDGKGDVFVPNAVYFNAEKQCKVCFKEEIEAKEKDTERKVQRLADFVREYGAFSLIGEEIFKDRAKKEINSGKNIYIYWKGESGGNETFCSDHEIKKVLQTMFRRAPASETLVYDICNGKERKVKLTVD